MNNENVMKGLQVRITSRCKAFPKPVYSICTDFTEWPRNSRSTGSR